MEIEISKHKLITEKINVELPYYFWHNLSSEEDETILYGKIDLNQSVMITRKTINYYKNIEFNLEINKYESISSSGLGNYFSLGYKCNERAFESMLSELKHFVNNL